MLKVKY